MDISQIKLAVAVHFAKAGENQHRAEKLRGYSCYGNCHYLLRKNEAKNNVEDGVENSSRENVVEGTAGVTRRGEDRRAVVVKQDRRRAAEINSYVDSFQTAYAMFKQLMQHSWIH